MLPQVQAALWLSLQLALIAVVVNSIFGTMVAWVMVRQEFRGKGFFNALIDLPFVVSPVITGYMVILLFGRQGWFAPLLGATGLKIAYALPGMLLVTIFVSLPFVIREVIPCCAKLALSRNKRRTRWAQAAGALFCASPCRAFVGVCYAASV